jgi:hypothetical protein
MAITFTTLSPIETVDIAGFQIRKRNCLTVNEEIAIRDLGAVVDKELKELTVLQADLELKQRVITILFQSRLEKTWTLEQTKAAEWTFQSSDGTNLTIEPDMIMLDALYEFFMLEQRRGRPIEEVEQDSTEKKQRRSR